MQVVTDYELGNGVQELWAEDAPLKCYSVPRNALSTKLVETIQRNNQKCFVYFLINDSQGSGTNEKGEILKRDIYIGETYSLETRKVDHKSKKPWWNRIVLFTKEEKFFNPSDIVAIEHILIDWYWDLPQYNRQNGRGSSATITDKHKKYADYIVLIMEHLTYGREYEKEEFLSDIQIDSNQELGDKIFNSIASIRKSIISDPKKLYTSFVLNDGGDKKYLCAVWPKKGGEWYEVEFYTKKENLDPSLSNFVKVRTNRNNRECVMAVRNDREIANMVAIIKNIIGVKFDSKSVELRGKRKSFRFSMIGLKKGDELVFKHDESIKCYVYDDTHVEYKGEVTSLSALAAKLLGKANSPQGTVHFMFKGRILDDLRKEKYGR